MKKTTQILLLLSIFILHLPVCFSQEVSILEKFQSEFSQVINATKNSIVTVSSKSTHSYTIDKTDGLISLFWNDSEEKTDKLEIIGTGIIFDNNGYIITQSNTLVDFEEIKVTLCDKTEYQAEYIGTDESTGLAIIKIDADSLQPVKLADSETTHLFSLVFVVGNSMGILPAASIGIINSIIENESFVVTAAITPGSNGAGVFSVKGELVGMLSEQLPPENQAAMPSLRTNFQHNGVALSSNLVKHTTDAIIKMRNEQKGWLGIDINEDSLKSGKIIVNSVITGSPAYQSGIKPGDWLLKYNNTFFTSLDQFASLIEQTKPGAIVSIDFIRDSRPLKVFPKMAKKRPYNFNPNKPRPASGQFMNNNLLSQPPVVISPEDVRKINERIFDLENEIGRLKGKLKQAEQ